jgi:hypothetical protein
MTGEGLRQTAEPGEQKEGSVQVAYGFVVVRATCCGKGGGVRMPSMRRLMRGRRVRQETAARADRRLV